MRYTLEPEHPITDAAAKIATGRTLGEWFAALDTFGGREKGRRAVNTYLVDQKVDPWWCTTIAVEYEKQHDARLKDGLFEGYFICATKTVAAPVEAVYAAWTTNEALSHWFGPGTSADVRDGGSYANADGDRGTFQRVRANKDLRLTFENPAFSAPTQVEAQLQDKGKGKTGLLVNHKRIQSRAEADGLRAAWGEALDRLKKHCES